MGDGVDLLNKLQGKEPEDGVPEEWRQADREFDQQEAARRRELAVSFLLLALIFLVGAVALVRVYQGSADTPAQSFQEALERPR